MTVVRHRDIRKFLTDIYMILRVISIISSVSEGVTGLFNVGGILTYINGTYGSEVRTLEQV